MSPRRELLHHFLDIFFDSEALAVSGEWQKTAIGAFAVFISVGIVVLTTYWKRYAILKSPAHSYVALYRSELRSDLDLLRSVAGVFLGSLLWWLGLSPA